MQVKDFDEFKYPQRKPWIVWLLILVFLMFAVNRMRTRRQGARQAVDDPGAREQLDPASVPGKTGAASDLPALAPVAVRDAVRRNLADAKGLISEDNYLPAREILFKALVTAGNDTVLRGEVEKLLGAVNIELVMTPRPMPEKIDYLVQRGDSIARIANRNGTTVELIRKSNRISNPNLIRAGDRLRVLTAPFSVRVSIERNDMVLELDGRFFKRYPVGTGKYGRTPVGTFEISDRIPEPVWWRPDGRAIPFGDPENILGTHWLAIRATGETEDARGYGLHGTWDDKSIGHAESAGCVRMHNADVEEIFTLLPLKTPVVIVSGR